MAETLEKLNTCIRIRGDRDGDPASFPVAAINSKSAGSAEPVSFGIPLARGAFSRVPATGRLVAPDGSAFTAQFTPLSHWYDGSIRWLLVDVVLSGVCCVGDIWRVTFDALPMGLEDRVVHAAEGKVLPNIRKFILDNSEWTLTDKKGRAHTPNWATLECTSSGPVRTTLKQLGKFHKLRGLQIEVRWDLYSDTSLAQCTVRIHNARRANHRGGLWDLGDAGAHLFQGFSYGLKISPRGSAAIRFTAESGQQAVVANEKVRLYQDSSGGENWQSLAHLNRNGRVPCRFRGYELEVDRSVTSGLRASPSLEIDTNEARIGAAFPAYWQQFPKSLELDRESLRFGLFPREWDDLHELQGGEQKTHEFWISAQSLDSPPIDLNWAFSPTRFVPISNVCEASGIYGLKFDKGLAASNGLTEILAEAIAGPRSFSTLRERVDEYGWRNFGDTHADHERLHYRGDAPFISHYNNQFDVVGGLLLQSLRTQDQRWFELADSLARHVIDIDIYHTAADRPAYNGGMFWFTDHYLHAHTSTHRTYSRLNAPQDGRRYGGGPGAEHNFTSGLLLYYHLTGAEAARQAVIGLADWVMRMEDGRRTILGILDDGPTGLATVGCAKPGRGGANSINALLDAWLLTHESAYLELCEQLIRRCIHPKTEIHQLDLLNLEVAWSYTMFYSSLAKYLRCKEEAGQLDLMYVYARRCLLNVGEWMLHNELPYFDQLEKLEFPTEAWPAQEFRKANVLRYAARYADEPDSCAMRRRADELGDRAWNDLLGFETRATARAIALVMTEGLYDCVLRSSRAESPTLAGQNIGFPAREPFFTQRVRIARMLRSPQGICRAAFRLANPLRWLHYFQTLRDEEGGR